MQGPLGAGLEHVEKNGRELELEMDEFNDSMIGYVRRGRKLQTRRKSIVHDRVAHNLQT
jgi:hypothetical protein